MINLVLFKTKQDIQCCAEKYPDLVCRAISTQFMENDLIALFEQIVLVCHEEGLIGHELFAIDGCKTPSDAFKQWSGTFKSETR